MATQPVDTAARQMVSDEQSGSRKCCGLAAEDLFTYAAFALTSLLFVLIYWRMTSEYGPATLDKLTSFHATRPFQYRILTIWLVRLAHLVVPGKITHLYFALTWAATFLMLIAFRRYLEFFFSKREAFVASFSMVYVMLWNYCIISNVYYPYDIPGLFFFILGLILIYRHRMAWYYPVFLLACLNRESAGFLILAYFIATLGRRKPLVVALHCLGQILVLAAVKAVVTTKFAHNPGSVMENHLAGNIQWLHDFLRVRLATLPTIFAYGLVWPLIAVGWARHPAFVKRLLWIFIPYHVAMFVVANIFETRQYSEMIPVLLTPALLGAKTLLARLPGSSVKSG